MKDDEIVGYDVAKLAKEKGFDWRPSMYFHSGVERDLREVGINGANPNKIPHSPHISCPTQTQLQRWLRDNGFGEVEVRHWAGTNKYPHHYGWEVKDNLGDRIGYSSKMFDTYELALENALAYALENLV